ncbi:site-specific DNA-methyltransferase [Micrococcus terreus]|uniref:DNA-methyltransferase n=1 Tax=Micrococcus terreus TaxID=574650 RepID=UPI0033E1B0E3
MSLYYQDEQATLYHGDCLTEHREWLEADVLVTDPPYGMGFKQGKRNSRVEGWTSRHTGVEIAGDADTAARDTAHTAWGDRPALMFGTWKRPAPAGVREVLVWDKVVSTGMGALDIPWRPSWEAIYVIGHGWTGKRGHGVLQHSLPTISDERKWHPTPKPLSLMERLIEKCPPGTIADPFAGSGSTLLAARNLGRKAIGVELEEKYCEIIAKRLSQGAFDLGGVA